MDEAEKMAPVLLHGVLHVTIFQVVKLSAPGCCTFFCKVLENIEETFVCGKSLCKLYATVDLDKARVGRTRQLKHGRSDPKWHQSFYVYCAHMASNVIFTIKIKDPIGAQVIGRAYLPATQLLHGKQLNQWLQVLNKHHKPIHKGAKIHVNLEFFDATKASTWSKGITSPKFPGVPHTFFPQRSGCRVTLYQDAHVPYDFDPKISLTDEGKCYQLHRCWEDIFDAISNAKYFIYITGWSVYTKITLVRDASRPKMILGELLKKKADEGVKVLMLVWDDKTSLKLLKKDGVMATHDEDTRSYFHNTNVHCVLCPRKPDNWTYFIQDMEISTMFSHHQKTVMVDSGILGDEESEKRRIVSFIGGIDLCDGRYDNPSHSLFRSLDILHQNDFYQHSIAHASIIQGGPRQPWHDIHCRLEGPVAWDVLSNFEQRWRRQGGKQELLVQVQQLVPSDFNMFPEDDSETWNVQLFRSIDGGAVSNFPDDDPEATARAGLVSWKDNVMDRSIQNAYINAIRRAKNFIYIENQYLIGSSFAWKPSNDIKIEEVGALNLIPKELSLKIVSKIKAGERFSVYIVIPMWPEGIPESGTVQAILKWQNKTMEMMYSDIAEALQREGLDTNPKDYLSFFCLGNREAKNSGEFVPPERPEHNSHYRRAQAARRFMIYVHAKMMIVDDEYIIIGSANINQRSMDGARDTEIAMGAYQPNYLADRKGSRGQIHGFRMSLWYEHLSRSDECFRQPETLECIQLVNKIASENWDWYNDIEADDLPGHLLTYPIGVATNGDITHLHGTEFFPDTEAPVFGSKSDVLPSILTT